jgi:outer membrane receptor protein involved in Fe transport
MRYTRKRTWLPGLVIALGAFASAGWVVTPSVKAQTTTTGSIAGKVTDPSGAVVPDAKVNLRDLDRGIGQEAKANKDGTFRFDLLPPGNYSVSATSSGFQTTTRQIVVAVGQVSTADLELSVGSNTETVTVTEQTPLLQTESGDLSANITETQASNIPNPGNDLTYIAQISPGAIMNTAGGGLGNFASYWISAVSNLFTVNGMDDNDPFLNVNNSGATNLTLGQNEVREVSVVTNGYTGQYTGLAGANVNYVTRGGTNEFHGRASWYWNGRWMNANSWFNNASGAPRSFVNANQYGGDIAGPIFKNKLFFYFNAEGLYLVIPTSTQTIIPSPAFAAATQANINARFGPGSTIAQFYQTIFRLYAGAPGANRAANTLPSGDCDASFLGLGLGFGAANPCGLSFFSNVSNASHEHLEAGRVDWNITDNNRFFGRVQHDRGLQATVTDPINRLFNVQSDQPEWQGQAELTHSFSPNTVNQLIVSGQWYSAIFTNANAAATRAAFPSTLQFAAAQFSNIGGIDFDFPQGRNVTQFQVSDDISSSRGVHTFKAGLKYRRNWVSNTDFSIFSTGRILPITEASFFNGGTDGRTNLTQSFPTALSQPFALYTVGGYIEDDWRVKPNLTLTLALRIDHESNPICTRNCFSLPVTQFPDLNSSPTTPYNRLLLVNQRRELPELQSILLQPRLGFAWQPHSGAHGTVVRGGVGIFYDNFPGALIDGFAENVPNDPRFTLRSSPTALISSPTDPASLFASAAAFNRTFQNGFRNGASFSTLAAALAGFSPPRLTSSVNSPKIMQYQKWSLEVEQQLGQNNVFSVQYVGNHAAHIFTQNSGINGCNNLPNGLPFTSLPPCLTNTPTLVASGLNPNFLSVDFGETIGVANYHGVTGSFTHRYKSGLVQVNYTYSHALDTVSNSGIPADRFGNIGFGATNDGISFPENPANPRQFNYANADYDVHHSLTANYVWELPIGRLTRGHGPSRLLSGWDVNGAVFLRSGFPFTLVDSATSTALQPGGYGAGGALVYVFGHQVAPGGTSINCSRLFAPTGTPQPSRDSCLSPGNFTTSPNSFGNVGRNSIRGPYYWNTDFSILKHTRVWEKVEFVIGAQFFNLFNHPNFDAPVTDTADPRFGQIIRTVSPPTTVFGSVLGADASPRLVQLKLQVTF